MTKFKGAEMLSCHGMGDFAVPATTFPSKQPCMFWALQIEKWAIPEHSIQAGLSYIHQLFLLRYLYLTHQLCPWWVLCRANLLCNNWFQDTFSSGTESSFFVYFFLSYCMCAYIYLESSCSIFYIVMKWIWAGPFEEQTWNDHEAGGIQFQWMGFKQCIN